MTKIELRCVCCGIPLGDTFDLVALKTETDHVFLVRTEHTKRLIDGEFISVRRVDQKIKED